jgi:23S rRNA (guanosine2251-2'-O)-methyltransferase
MKQLNKTEIKRFFRKFPNRDKEIYLVLENIQYARNVAGIFRTADAAGVRRLYLTGISHKPPFGKDLKKASRRKEDSVEWMYSENTGKVLKQLKQKGFLIVAIELTDESFPLAELPKQIAEHNKVCFVAGNEVYGVVKDTLSKCDKSVFVPMYGRGASLNVGVSVGVVLYGV